MNSTDWALSVWKNKVHTLPVRKESYNGFENTSAPMEIWEIFHKTNNIRILTQLFQPCITCYYPWP
jgi:hypothetical protein